MELNLEKNIGIARQYENLMRTFWSPTVGAIYYCYDKRICTYDDHLIRNTYLGERKLKISNSFKDPSGILLMGSSAAMGCCASQDRFTLSSQLASKLQRPVINLGNPGSTIIQNSLMTSSLFNKYATRDESPGKLLFYGFENDFSLFFSNAHSIFYPACDLINFDIRATFSLIGKGSKWVSYVQNILKELTEGSKQNESKKLDIRKLFSALQSDYVKTFSKRGMYSKNRVFLESKEIVESHINEEAINSIESESRTKSIFQGIDLISKLPELISYLLEESTLEEYFRIIEPSLEASLAILIYLQRKYNLDIYMLSQPNLFLLYQDIVLHPAQLMLSDSLLNKGNFSLDNILGLGIKKVIHKNLITRIKKAIDESGLKAKVYDFNEDLEIKNELRNSASSIFCDHCHMTDQGFNLMASRIKKIIKD